jgi:hypothetical protein
MSRIDLDPALDPRDRIITTTAKGPIGFGFDETGSMGDLPMIIRDKYALVAGQVDALGLVKDPVMSVCGIGDAENNERAPVQIGDFLTLREVGDGFKRICLEGKGGGNYKESYDLWMYYFAYMCEMPNAETPFLILTGDEGIRETLPQNRLKQLFGSKRKHKTVSLERVMSDLERKFMGNIFLIRRFYSANYEEDVMNQWVRLLGRGRIAMLERSTDGDKSIGDVTVGLLALATGRMTLDEYCVSMIKAREEPQTKARIARVRKTLKPIAEYCADRLLPDDERVSEAEMDFAKRTATFGAPDPTAERPPRGRKPGKKGRKPAKQTKSDKKDQTPAKKGKKGKKKGKAW